MNIIIITGANRGLGLALANYYIGTDNTMVISMSRELAKEHLEIKETLLRFIQLDLIYGLNNNVMNQFDEILINLNPVNILFFNNAAVVAPINKIGKFDDNAIRKSLNVNLVSQIELINFLASRFNSMIIINISSGAAYNPIDGWSLYSTGKAAMLYFLKSLSNENSSIKVLNVDPGVMNTRMQKDIRESDFIGVKIFKEFSTLNKLKKTEEVVISIIKKLSDEIGYIG
jgi:benzil reductase ((S)-benzoin forming)